jgi:branched-subunit amino acid ABC-type transport system permease component
MDWMYFLELAVNGGLAGLMYGLVAMGIVLVYKSSSVPNLAQGALVMLGAYMVLAFANGLGIPIWGAIPLAVVSMFFMGVGIERVALRRLAGRPIVMILMMTLGVDIFVRATAMTIWGGSGRPSATIPCSSGRCCSTEPTWWAQPSPWCFLRCSCCSSAHVRAWCCGPSPMTTPHRGR